MLKVRKISLFLSCTFFFTFLPGNLKNTLDYQSKNQKSTLCYNRNLRKIDFLDIFDVKTQQIIVQKSQNSARLSNKKVNKVPCILGAIGEIQRNIRGIPPPQKKKNQYVPQIAPIISGNFLTFLPDNLKNTLDYQSKKSKRCPVLQ